MRKLNKRTRRKKQGFKRKFSPAKPDRKSV